VSVLRTPDERFTDLPGFPYQPRYLTVPDPVAGSLRMHFIDEGPRDVQPILLLHGQPTWSYLYRHVVADLVARGHRVVAPDLIGFGRSD
jgi:haloalkane dehalogenase